MIYLLFFACVAIVVTFSIKLSNCADWFEQNTKMTGALVGFFLAAATSLPELVSGATSVIIGQQELAIASILGSNLFNYNIVAISNLAFITYFAFNKLEKQTNKINYYILTIYLLVITTSAIGYKFSFTLFNRISILSILIIIVYILSVRTLSEAEESVNEIAPKNIIIRKGLYALLYAFILIISSSLLAKSVELIMYENNISASLAGSVLLGASTSLPEFVSSITLMRKRQYDIAISSVLSSNLFNFFVFGLLDFITADKITSYFSSETYFLILYGVINTVVLTLAIKFYKVKSRFLYVIPSVLVLAVYSIYLISQQ